MNDTLPQVGHFEFSNAQIFTILVKRIHLQTRYRVGDTVATFSGGNIMIRHRED
jgi:hypothetical protein